MLNCVQFVYFYDLGLDFWIDSVDFSLEMATVFYTVSFQRIWIFVILQLDVDLSDGWLKPLSGDKAAQIRLHSTQFCISILFLKYGFTNKLILFQPFFKLDHFIHGSIVFHFWIHLLHFFRRSRHVQLLFDFIYHLSQLLFAEGEVLNPWFQIIYFGISFLFWNVKILQIDALLL